MSLPFEIYVDTSEVDMLFRQYAGIGDGKKLLTARRRAVRRTLESVRAEARRITRERYTSRDPRPLAERITMNSLSHFELYGELNLSGPRGRGLRHFSPLPLPPKRVPEGVSSLIREAGQRKVYGGPGGGKPFWMRTQQGFLALFGDSGGKKHPGQSRWANYKMLFGPSNIQALLPESSRERMLKKAQETLKKRMDHEVARMLEAL